MDEDHALSEFLCRRLTEVGLDPDTYGPYVLPLLVEADTDVDEEEWDGVMELLQASSESHSDDERTWIDLRKDIQLAWKQHNDKVNDEARKQKIENERRIQKEIERDRQIAKEAAEMMEAEREKEGGDASKTVTNTDADAADDEAHRRALMARFGYENDDDVEGGNRGAGGGGGEQQVILTNQQAAAQLKQEQVESMRAKKNVTTKKDEQQKTAQSRKDKANLKEERRKRATKGERRR